MPRQPIACTWRLPQRLGEHLRFALRAPRSEAARLRLQAPRSRSPAPDEGDEARGSDRRSYGIVGQHERVGGGSATGSTMRPPGASCSSRLGGGAGAEAWTAIASNGARSGAPRLPSPTRTSTVLDARLREQREAFPGTRGEGLEALDAEHLARRAGRGSRSSSRSRYRSRARARSRSSPSAWQIAATTHGWEIVCPSPIGSAESRVGAAAQALVDEQLARHLRHRREHALVVDPAPAELALDHPLALVGVIGRQNARKCTRAVAAARARSRDHGRRRRRRRARAWRESG